MIYQQSALPQATIPLGTSGLDSSQAGCFVVSCANILNLAGYAISAAEVLNGMNRIGGYTPDGYAYWGAFHTLYPQFTITGQGGAGEYRLVQGHRDNNYHWWVECSSGVYDPWTGGSNHPFGYVPLDPAVRLSVNCTKNPNLLQPVVISVSSAPAASTSFTIRTNTGLNFRKGPGLGFPIMVTYPAGTEISCKGVATGDTVNGSSRWCVSAIHGWYCTDSLVTIISTNQPA